MIVRLFTNGTEDLYLYKNDDVDVTYEINGDAEPHHVIFYVETARYGDICQIPVFVCSDRYLSYFFGVTDMTNRMVEQLTTADTELVIENILGDDPADYKPNATIFGEFVREFQGYTTKIVFNPEYHLWKAGGSEDDENKYYDVKIGKTEFSFTFSPEDYLNALINIVVQDEELKEVLFEYINM